MPKVNDTNFPNRVPVNADYIPYIRASDEEAFTVTVEQLADKIGLIAAITLDSIADLRALDVIQMEAGQAVNLLGYTTAGDGGGGEFIYDPDSAATDNRGTVIEPDSGLGRWLRVFGTIMDMRWFGGSTGAIQNGLNALSQGGTILLSPAGETVISQISIPNNGKSYVIQGSGVGTKVTRSNIYPAGDIFYAGLGSKVAYKDFTIQNAEGFNNTSGYGLNFDSLSNSVCSAERVWIYNGKNGVRINASDQVFLDKVLYRQSSDQVAAGYGATAGLVISGGSTSIFVSNCSFATQAVTETNALLYGVYIDNADGSQFVNCHIKARIGVNFLANAALQISNVFFSNCIIDECLRSGIAVGGTTTGVFQNIRFNACQIVGYNRASETDGVYLDCPDLSVFQLNGCNIDGWRGSGVAILQGTYISVDGTDITDVDAGDDGNWCVKIIGGTNIKINGGSMGALNQSPPLVNGAITINGTADYVSITGVQCIGTQSEPITVITTPVHLNISGCMPQQNVIPSVASATSIALEVYDTVSITGTTNVQTITGGWVGRRQSFRVVGGLSFVTGGNIVAAVVKAANTLAQGVFDGTNWTIQ